LLLRGPEGWDSFVEIARSPLFLTLDVILLFGVVYHMFNGIRVALVGMGVANRQQKGLFYGLVGLALVLFVVGAVLIFVK
jgi:succinate dehydrogenase / fumarate reductase cytochrome b subunit